MYNPDAQSQLATNQATMFPRAVAPGAAVTVEGVVRKTQYESDKGYRVLRVEVNHETQTWCGQMPELSNGCEVRATGQWEEHKTYGPQLRVEAVFPIEPSTADGIAEFLGSGIVKGIGPTLAKKIVTVFGADTIATLEQSPNLIASRVKGISLKKAEALAAAWEERKGFGQIMIWLHAHGVPGWLAARIHARYKARAIEVVSTTPYKLAIDLSGVGFKTADEIAQRLGVGHDSISRVMAGLLHCMGESSDSGHCFMSATDLLDAAQELLGCDAARIQEGVDGLVKLERVVADPDVDAVFLAPLYKAEQHIAQRLRTLLATPACSIPRDTSCDGVDEVDEIGEVLDDLDDEEPVTAAEPACLRVVRAPQADGPTPAVMSLEDHAAGALAEYEKRNGIVLADIQRDAIYAAARQKVLVITGGPGTGKTTLLKAMLAMFDAAKLTVAMAAPTGRAAKRMSEATGRHATTIHRLLIFDPKSGVFLANASKPLRDDVVVIDEVSMLDLHLADAVLSAVHDGARLVFVGDVDQLPSVGPGAVLRDIIDSGAVPTVRLKVIFRQAAGSLIIENAHRINAGQPPRPGPKDGDFHIITRVDAFAAANTMVELVASRIPAAFGLNPLTEIQVLCPMRKGDAGVDALNVRLQHALNPQDDETKPSVTRGKTVYRLGDRVMQIKNDYDRDVFNGDVGQIVHVNPEAKKDDAKVIVMIDDRRVAYTEKHLAHLVLAYAMSIHKAQGSTIQAVVIPVIRGHFVMLSRNLVYTAVTRAAKLVVLVADPKAIDIALAETRRELRRTRLTARLQESS
jgi:exodeoxyribonuclease V alpha subunit